MGRDDDESFRCVPCIFLSFQMNSSLRSRCHRRCPRHLPSCPLPLPLRSRMPRRMCSTYRVKRWYLSSSTDTKTLPCGRCWRIHRRRPWNYDIRYLRDIRPRRCLLASCRHLDLRFPPTIPSRSGTSIPISSVVLFIIVVGNHKLCTAPAIGTSAAASSIHDTACLSNGRRRSWPNGGRGSRGGGRHATPPTRVHLPHAPPVPPPRVSLLHPTPPLFPVTRSALSPPR
jgi:hypothetical protein